jgi:transcription antitermination protein NusB
MISRRLLRIKAMQVLYAYFKNEDHSINNTEKELFFSIQKSYDLYHYLMYLIIDVQDYARNRIDIARQKRIPTYEDLNPNLRFADNKFVAQLRENTQLNVYVTRNKLSWHEYPELIREFYGQIIESEVFKAYMNDPVCTYNEDKAIICRIYEEIIAESESLMQILEELSIYWNDDMEFAISMVLKTFEKFKPFTTREIQLLPLFQKEEDRDFVKTLVRKTILNHSDFRELINKYTQNWDFERIAFMDIIALMMAITEVIEFQSIPVKVTLNEYIEISKYYSTNKSSNFINGVLDKVVEHLQKENKFVKIGRGLANEK